ncbi:hypothetical protein BGZ68_009413, partial [Mortierella alpina]
MSSSASSPGSAAGQGFITPREGISPLNENTGDPTQLLLQQQQQQQQAQGLPQGLQQSVISPGDQPNPGQYVSDSQALPGSYAMEGVVLSSTAVSNNHQFLGIPTSQQQEQQQQQQQQQRAAEMQHVIQQHHQQQQQQQQHQHQQQQQHQHQQQMMQNHQAQQQLQQMLDQPQIAMQQADTVSPQELH